MGQREGTGRDGVEKGVDGIWPLGRCARGLRAEIRGNPRQSAVIRGNQRQSAVLSGEVHTPGLWDTEEKHLRNSADSSPSTSRTCARKGVVEKA